jgi:hypothetical protein
MTDGAFDAAVDADSIPVRPAVPEPSVDRSVTSRVFGPGGANSSGVHRVRGPAFSCPVFVCVVSAYPCACAWDVRLRDGEAAVRGSELCKWIPRGGVCVIVFFWGGVGWVCVSVCVGFRICLGMGAWGGTPPLPLSLLAFLPHVATATCSALHKGCTYASCPPLTHPPRSLFAARPALLRHAVQHVWVPGATGGGAERAGRPPAVV